jgi:iron complex outermembrane receptor protein
MILAVLLAAAAPAATATTAATPAAAGETLEEVVVSARRVEERAAGVPLAIDVLDASVLAAAGIGGLYGVAAHAPGLRFESMWGGFGAAPVLRGQAQPTFGGDNVGVFVDGVYQALRVAIDVEPLDLERIEVVRGPQSALFGHSSFAGAVHYVAQAPTAELATGGALEAGSDAYLAASGFVGGPVTSSGRWLARLAVAHREADGTEPNAAAPGGRLGGYERDAGALTIASAGDSAWRASLAARWQHSRFEQPPVAALEYPAYNCGGLDPALGAWSYYCGPVPVAASFALSAGTPDSDSRVAQVALHLGTSIGPFELESDTSWYRGRVRLYRDFDGSPSGQPFGVCDARINCPGASGPSGIVSRLVTAEAVFHQAPDAEEIAQELRLLGPRGGTLEWMLGLTAFQTRDTQHTAYGFTSPGLAAAERLAALLPATPQLAGPVSIANRALVPDANAAQVDLQLIDSERRTFALFGALGVAPTEGLRLRAELRASRERIETNGITANFVPGFGRAIPALEFDDVTPRLSADLRAGEDWFAYASAAKGSRSGGVNPIPGLLPEEQGFEPETNWTYELGLRYAPGNRRLLASATLFYIDWTDTQITALSNTPGVASLITGNTAGVTTRGIELTVDAQLGRLLRASASLSRVEPRFRAGGEDPGSSAFCGVRATSATSSFCTIGPTRGSAAPGTRVPYVDGNALLRAAELQWSATLALDPPAFASGWRAFARLDANYQDEVYDRAINGASFGERTLLDLRAGLRRAPWSVELWATNLGDERYVRAMATRQPQFFPTTPRPQDLVHGEERRLGITLRYARP